MSVLRQVLDGSWATGTGGVSPVSGPCYVCLMIDICACEYSLSFTMNNEMSTTVRKFQENILMWNVMHVQLFKTRTVLDSINYTLLIVILCDNVEHYGPSDGIYRAPWADIVQSEHSIH